MLCSLTTRQANGLNGLRLLTWSTAKHFPAAQSRPSSICFNHISTSLQALQLHNSIWSHVLTIKVNRTAMHTLLQAAFHISPSNSTSLPSLPIYNTTQADTQILHKPNPLHPGTHSSTSNTRFTATISSCADKNKRSVLLGILNPIHCQNPTILYRA